MLNHIAIIRVGTSKRVQLNDKISLILTSSYDLELLGFVPLNIPITVNTSGASEVYYK